MVNCRFHSENAGLGFAEGESGRPNASLSKTRFSKGGFSLVEVAMAIGVMAFAMMALLGLLPLGIQSNQQAIKQFEASSLLSSLETDLAVAHQRGLSVSPFYQIILPIASTPTTYYLALDGTFKAETPDAEVADRDLRITLVETQAGSGVRPQCVRVQVSWPHVAIPAPMPIQNTDIRPIITETGIFVFRERP